MGNNKDIFTREFRGLTVSPIDKSAKQCPIFPNKIKLTWIEDYTMFTLALLVTSFALAANESVFCVCST